MCELLVGLDHVRILAVDEPAADSPLEVTIETICDTRPACNGCGRPAVVKDRDDVRLVDLASMGRPVRLVWRKRRWQCRNPVCGSGSWTEINHQIASPRQVMTRRAGAWATIQVGRHGRVVTDVAAELGCDWHTINDTVVAWGDALLDADVDRIGTCTAVGLDETSFVRRGRYRRTEWSTTITDVAQGRLLDVIEGRTAAAPIAWLDAQGQRWLDQVQWAALDLSGAYRKVFNTILPHARQVADPFHVIRLANQRVDEVRRRVQNTILGHRGRKTDPLYRCRRLLIMAEERHTLTSRSKLTSLLHLGDPLGEVRDAWIAN